MNNRLLKYEDTISKSKVQSKMHLPSDVGKEDDVLFSVHQRGKQKTLWYKSSWEQMDVSVIAPTNPEYIVYKSKIFPFNSLHKSLFTTVLPDVSAKEDYEIRWCDNLFINMVKEFKLVFNYTELQTGNDKYIYFDSKLKSNWDDISYDLGNRDNLTCWTDKLTSDTISLSLPWCYSRDKSDAFPLDLCGNKDSLKHEIQFNLKLSNLLLIRDKEGNMVDFDPELIEVKNGIDSVNVPELEGLYTILTSQECELGNCTSDEVEGVKEYYSHSCYYLEDENEVTLGKRITLKVDGKNNSPVSDIYWGAMNINKSEKYKDIILETSEELSPIKNSKIESSIGVIMDTTVSYKTERGYLSQLYETTPLQKGMNCWKNSILRNEDPRKFTPNINFAGGSLTVNLSEKKSDDKFLVFAVLKNIKRFRFISYPRNNQERLNMSATIEVDEEH